MKKIITIAVLLLTLICTAPMNSQDALIDLEATSTFFEPIIFPFDFFTLTNSSDTGIQISEVKIDTSGSAFFDTAPTPPGFLLWSPFFPISDGTGFTGATGGSDGSTMLTLNFNDFDPSETFIFGIDVDKSDGPFVGGADFAGSTLAATFTGDLIFDTTLVGTYGKTRHLKAKADVSGEVPPIPEPATLLLVGTGLVGLTGFRKKFKS